MIGVGFVLMALGSGASAQDFSVPLSWRKFWNTHSLAERISIGQKGIDRMVEGLDRNTAEFAGIGFWQSGNVYSAMAHQDAYAKTTTNKATTVAMLGKAFELHEHYDSFGYYNDDALWWAQSAMYAYNTYGDTNLFNAAVDTWEHVSAYVITADQVKSGQSPLKDSKISGTCEGKSMEGAVFWRPVANDPSVNSITTGLYLTLSAYLAEATKDPKYTDAAIKSAQWIQRVNLANNNIVLDSITVNKCVRSPADWIFTYNSGKYIEGLSVLADVTGDAQWKDLLAKIVASATKAAPWQGEDGIITEGASPDKNNDGVGFKAVLVRGLTEAFQRSSNDGLRILIHSYIAVQYNALLDLASDDDNEYSSAWHGPAQAFTGWGQLAALDVLVGAVPTTT